MTSERDKVNHKKEFENELKEKKGNVPKICDICGAETTYKDLAKHRRSEQHLLKCKEMKRKKRQEEKKEKVDKPIEIKETYYNRFEDVLSEIHREYIVTLSVLLALRYVFNKQNQDFRISIINSNFGEFKELVFELCSNGIVCEIQAIQCKEIQDRSSIFTTNLLAEIGKFSVKAQCDSLGKLRQRLNCYNKTFFKLYTVSNFTVTNKEKLPLLYEDLNDWQSEKERGKWRGKQLIVPPYKKSTFFNTTDDPNNVHIFRVLEGENNDLNNDLSKFAMFTNQSKLENLHKIIRLILDNKFGHNKDISGDLIHYVSHHFRENRNQSCHKLSKNNFLFKIAELFFDSYTIYPEQLLKTKKVPLWDEVVQKFDVIIMKKRPETVETIFGLIKCEQPDLKTVYKSLWKASKAPLVLTAKDYNDLKLIGQVIHFLKKENLTLTFFLMTDLNIHPGVFPQDLNIFLTLQDLTDGRCRDILGKLQKVKVDVVGCWVALEEFIDHNEDFLGSKTPETLLNILLGRFSFKDGNVAFTKDIVDNTWILRDDVLRKIKQQLTTEEHEEHLSYVISLDGNPTQIKVPPQL